jgi:hypothetical protein
MIQTVLTSVIVLAAALYVGWYVYSHVFIKKDKCDGCAIKKIVDAQALSRK